MKREFDNSAVGARERETLVLGMGATGASCARYFAARGHAAWFADSRNAPPCLEAIREAMPEAGLLPGQVPERAPAGVKRIVISPGVDYDLPLLADARRRGIPVVSDLDLFVTQCKAPIIAITGSNGKSTVTTMVHAMLGAAGWNVAAGANLGTPALDLLDPGVRAYVLELSSFQLERSALLPLAAAAVLNLAPDHLDKHGTMSAYRSAKARIYANCRTAVVNRDEPQLAALVPSRTAVLSYGLSEPRGAEFGLLTTQDGQWLACGHERLMPVSALAIVGRHNVSNALAALALVQALGGDIAAACTALKTFRGLPHRMQVVATHAGVNWIDDSKATNVAAALTSIRGVSGPLVLIAGGDGKGQSFHDLAEALRRREAFTILIGCDREKIAAELEGCAVEFASTLPLAVERARALASPGYTVLLAPACSSLDMFRNYEHRGQVFADAVKGARHA